MTDRQTDRRIAFLILAHTDPYVLKKLCEALDDCRFDLYIHIDKKSDIASFHIENYALKYSHLYVIPKRINVRWGDISVVDATISMYRQAYESENYFRYVTLSGLDFPIKSNDEIYNTLTRDNIEFIQGNPVRGAELHKVKNIYLWKLGRFGGVIRRVMKLLRIERKGELNINGKAAQVYFAPQWHALSGKFVEYMLSVIQNDNVREFFRFSYAPDELMLPTILFNNEEFKKHAIACDFPMNTHYNAKSTLHYLNYEPVIEVFDEESFEKIIDSDKLFVRKVKFGISNKLIELILARIQCGANSDTM